MPSSSGGHSKATPSEFITELRGPLLGHLHLPHGFSMVMEVDRPSGFSLGAHGCPHGAMQVHAEYPKPHSMLLGRGWKAFAQTHGLEGGYVLRFKLMETRMLVVKFYGCSGVRLGSCEEGSSGAECSDSSDSDGEGGSGNGAEPSPKPGGIKSEDDSPGSD
ncbi:l-ascorbate oxidase-like protein [Hordeum vulgare]|nr:l-ascorbate oxidase-like protein [Hordeum vulgare]